MVADVDMEQERGTALADPHIVIGLFVNRYELGLPV
jgi:hypothetical protein